MQVSNVRGEIARRDRGGIRNVLLVQLLDEIAKIALVRLQRGGGESGFNFEVGQEVTNRWLEAAMGRLRVGLSRRR